MTAVTKGEVRAALSNLPRWNPGRPERDGWHVAAWESDGGAVTVSYETRVSLPSWPKADPPTYRTYLRWLWRYRRALRHAGFEVRCVRGLPQLRRVWLEVRP